MFHDEFKEVILPLQEDLTSLLNAHGIGTEARYKLIKSVRLMMATVEELKGKIEVLTADVVDLGSKVDALIAKGSGTPVVPDGSVIVAQADLDTLAASVDNAEASVKGIVASITKVLP